MRVVLHHEVVSTLLDDAQRLASAISIDGLKIGYSSEILAKYHELFGKNQTFSAWFSACQTARKFEVLGDSLINKYLPDERNNLTAYTVASYCHGHTLISADSTNFTVAESGQAADFGINVIDSKELVSKRGLKKYGVDPFLTLNLTRSRNYSYTVIQSYFKRELNLIIYDKYIREEALKTIVNVCTVLNDNAQVVLITSSANKCKTAAEIEAAIRAVLPNVNFMYEIATSATMDEMHDRYMFLGNRIQMTFSRGLDVFGSLVNNVQINKRGNISMDWIPQAPLASFVCKSGTTYSIEMVGD